MDISDSEGVMEDMENYSLGQYHWPNEMLENLAKLIRVVEGYRNVHRDYARYYGWASALLTRMSLVITAIVSSLSLKNNTEDNDSSLGVIYTATVMVSSALIAIPKELNWIRRERDHKRMADTYQDILVKIRYQINLYQDNHPRVSIGTLQAYALSVLEIHNEESLAMLSPCMRPEEELSSTFLLQHLNIAQASQPPTPQTSSTELPGTSTTIRHPSDDESVASQITMEGSSPPPSLNGEPAIELLDIRSS